MINANNRTRQVDVERECSKLKIVVLITRTMQEVCSDFGSIRLVTALIVTEAICQKVRTKCRMSPRILENNGESE